MEKGSNRRVKTAIYLCAILMMGAIAVASNIASIAAAFPEAGQTKVVAYLISAPCLVVILVTLVTGKLMDFVPKKTLMIAGVLFWLVGGSSALLYGQSGADPCHAPYLRRRRGNRPVPLSGTGY